MTKLPQSIAKKLEAYPAIAKSLEPVYDKPSLPTGYQPKLIEVFCDQQLALQWANGYLTHQIYVHENYKPKTIEWAIDGEMAWVLVEGETLLDRLENPIDMPDLEGEKVKG
jgi:phosphoenolpyruvate synthase/pyruvate phosphate dikinase